MNDITLFPADIAAMSVSQLAALPAAQKAEIDKNLVEHIGDPLMHLVRNSLDHGIEPTTVRLERGKLLLARGMPVSEVALAVGFFDQSHFNHGFRQAFGLTPADYRQQMLPS